MWRYVATLHIVNFETLPIMQLTKRLLQRLFQRGERTKECLGLNLDTYRFAWINIIINLNIVWASELSTRKRIWENLTTFWHLLWSLDCSHGNPPPAFDKKPTGHRMIIDVRDRVMRGRAVVIFDHDTQYDELMRGRAVVIFDHDTQ